MILKSQEDLFFLQFQELLEAPGVWHAYFLRSGGASRGPFHSLNLSFGVGDDAHHIKANRRRISQMINGGRLVSTRQVHQTQVLTFSKKNGTPVPAQGAPPLCGDAMVTDMAGQYLMIQVADCQAVMLHDPVLGVVANVHSGWRGSIANIIGQTLEAMTRTYGSRPADIIAGIGPSLGPCCAEFIHYRKEIPEPFWIYGDHRNRFDFWSISRDQLMSTGVLGNHIHQSRICTRCNPHLFYSYRAEKVTGRFAAVIGLNPDGHGHDNAHHRTTTQATQQTQQTQQTQ
jgi:YfiH family protein